MLPVTKKQWNEFVVRNGGSVYHLFEWQEICTKVFSYMSFPGVIKKGRKILGVMPGVCRGRKKNHFVSLPLVDCAGPLATRKEILSRLISLTRRKYSIWEIFTDQKIGLKKGEKVYQIFELILNTNYSQIFKDKYHHKTRNMVRKAMHQNFDNFIGKPTQEDIHQFSNMYQMTMKKIGALTFPEKLFEEIFSTFNDKVLFSKVVFQEKLVAALWLFAFNNKIYVWGNVSDQKYLSSGANYLAYDATVRFACENGFKAVVFGASNPGSTQEFFKERWGAIPHDVYLYSSSVNAANRRWKILNFLKLILRVLPTTVYGNISNIILRYA